VTDVRELFLIIQVNKTRDFAQGGSDYFPRFGRGHASHRFSVFVVIGQDVIHLPVLQFSHMIFYGIAQS